MSTWCSAQSRMMSTFRNHKQKRCWVKVYLDPINLLNSAILIKGAYRVVIGVDNLICVYPYKSVVPSSEAYRGLLSLRVHQSDVS